MKKLLIVGAGDLGRIIYQWAQEVKSFKDQWQVVEFIDDDPCALNNYGLSHKIRGSISRYVPAPGEYLTCSIADPATRHQICKNLLDKGAAFANIIHPNAYISQHCQIGKGVIIFPGAYIFPYAKVGDFVIINSLTTIGHDATVEQGCVLSAHCDVMGKAYLDEMVFLGSGAKILPEVTVGPGAKVGAGSVVIRNIRQNTSVFGNPAKAIYDPTTGGEKK